jgi:DNA-binding LacI/PurR family transcriptional regulator
MGEDRPSIRTVAARAGVSTATVSNVLNLRRNVAPPLAARVHAAVAELGYIADLGAARLRSRRSNVAGIVVPDIANPFFAALVAELEEQARAVGYDLLMVSSGGDPRTEEARLRALLTWRPAGLIVVPSDDLLAARTIVRSVGVPMVVADRIPMQCDFDVVGVDNHAEAAVMIRHLIAGGRRRILVAPTDLSIGNMGERLAGCREAARGEAEIEVVEAGLTVAAARERLSARLGAGRRPEAIFALTNIVTLGTVGAMAERGVVAPRDLALAGFDDDEWMRVVSPSITVMRQPTVAMARAIWSRLMARIGGEAGPPQEVRLPCALECRGSTASRAEAARAA